MTLQIQSDSKAHLLYGGCITNGIDAVVGALDSQELVCDDGPEVRLTPLWQPRLQLQQLGHVNMGSQSCSCNNLDMSKWVVATTTAWTLQDTNRGGISTVMMFRKGLQISLWSVLLPAQQVKFTRLAQRAQLAASLAMLAAYSVSCRPNIACRQACDCLRMSIYIRMATTCKAGYSTRSTAKRA